MKSAAGLLFKSEQKRRKLRRLVREISRFFSRPDSLMPEGGKSGPFLSHKGLTMLPNGEIVRDTFRSVSDLDTWWGEMEFEVAQDSHLVGEALAPDADCRDLVVAINEGRWDDCHEFIDRLYGRVEDLSIGDRASRRSYDEIFEAFTEDLDFIQTVEFSPLWIPTTPELLTAEDFVFVDRRLADEIVKNPKSLFTADPRFFEELMASIFADLGCLAILTKRTRDGGRDVICLTRKDGLDLKLIIECKRYAAHRKISVNQIRALYGVKQNENVTKAILATTSSFTPDAVDFAKPHIWELQLLDYDAILRLISGYAAGKRSIGRS